MSKKKSLVQIIKDNPGCVAIIDNDSWYIDRTHDYPEDWENWTEKAQEKWHKNNLLISDDDDFIERGHCRAYQSGNCYGGDILQALADIVGIKIESV